ncbi:hypothetical protein E8E12_004226 [Didymella heteroderae]|uniref:Zinc finger PHD-type domain-containing protein n=1 Tax=Didymella heteroderae TaxID=1769908 RepID=A0A9P5BXS9_9PLEO|nr:hypothetical protein E8E12_004226 [Didymella heteroderae]
MSDLVRSIKTYVSCLMDLGLALASPALEPEVDDKPCQIILGQRLAHDYYSDLITAKFPQADTHLLQSLGKINWERYLRMQRERDANAHKEQSAISSNKSRSEFQDSGLGTSVPPVQSSYAESTVSFMTSVADGAIYIMIFVRTLVFILSVPSAWSPSAIVKHLEDIAIASLPRDVDTDNESESGSLTDSSLVRLSEEESPTIKCICGYGDDDGHTVLCEVCDTWQHIICYYEHAAYVPDVHECVDCSPRRMDIQRAVEKQRSRKELELPTSPRKNTKKAVSSKRESAAAAPSQYTVHVQDDPKREMAALRTYIFANQSASDFKQKDDEVLKSYGFDHSSAGGFEHNTDETLLPSIDQGGSIELWPPHGPSDLENPGTRSKTGIKHGPYSLPSPSWRSGRTAVGRPGWQNNAFHRDRMDYHRPSRPLVTVTGHSTRPYTELPPPFSTTFTPEVPTYPYLPPASASFYPTALPSLVPSMKSEYYAEEDLSPFGVGYAAIGGIEIPHPNLYVDRDAHARLPAQQSPYAPLPTNPPDPPPTFSGNIRSANYDPAAPSPVSQPPCEPPHQSGSRPSPLPDSSSHTVPAKSGHLQVYTDASSLTLPSVDDLLSKKPREPVVGEDRNFTRRARRPYRSEHAPGTRFRTYSRPDEGQKPPHINRVPNSPIGESFQATVESGGREYSFIVANTPAELQSKSNMTQVRKRAMQHHLNIGTQGEASPEDASYREVTPIGPGLEDGT